MSKRLLAIIFPYLLASILIIAECKEKAVSPQSEDFYSNYTKAQLDSMTLASLEKVADHPFYTVTYYGDYGFSDYIKPGANYSTFINKTSPFEKFSLCFNNTPTTSTQGIRISQFLNSEFRNLKSKIINSFWGCTCFAAMGNMNNIILGRNFDWYDHIPLLLFTNPPDGYASVSMVDLDYFGFNRGNLPELAQNKQRLLDTPWLPFDGMNEMGVAIGMMAIDYAEPPYDSKKHTIGEIEVIRLVLDYAKSTEHAVELIKKYNIRMEAPPIHYLLADSSGQSAIIEFVGGKMIVMKNTEPWQVSTNFIIHGSGAPENVSCWRYNKAYNTLKSARGNMTNTSAMYLLQSVSQTSTIWSMVYQMSSGKIDVVVGRKFDDLKSFILKSK